MEACGYYHNVPSRLYGKGGGTAGLGLATTQRFIGYNASAQIDIGLLEYSNLYTQVKFAGLIAAQSLLLYGSNKKGTIGSYLDSFGASFNRVYITLSNYPGYRYYSFTVAKPLPVQGVVLQSLITSCVSPPTTEPTSSPSSSRIPTQLPSQGPTVLNSKCTGIAYQPLGISTLTGYMSIKQYIQNTSLLSFEVASSNNTFTDAINCALFSNFTIAPLGVTLISVSEVVPTVLELEYTIEFQYTSSSSINTFYSYLSQSLIDSMKTGEFFVVFNEYCYLHGEYYCLDTALSKSPPFITGPFNSAQAGTFSLSPSSLAPVNKNAATTNSSSIPSSDLLYVWLSVAFFLFIFLLVFSICWYSMSKSRESNIKLDSKEIFMDEDNLDNVTWLERLGRKRSTIGKRKDSNFEVNPLALRQSIAEFGINVDEDGIGRKSVPSDDLRRNSTSSDVSIVTDDRRSSLTINPSNRKSSVGDENINYITSPLTTKRNSIIFSNEELL